ncbi:hypothetical protein HPB51_020586 [Rhipicephalus microplus]|uniref:CCHC-type domain-containing protein n=1 Tax=Rhipicephalus microplus TaxID=6941 RepID=A0A9J6DJD2_RHIMP|nr:hypothetical protein HPB51_020586 [Rhipicephalus microplus]
MSMQVVVDGKDVSLEELQFPGCATAVNRWKVKTVPDATGEATRAKGEATRAKPAVATVLQPRQLPTNVKKQVIAAPTMPKLPKDHLRAANLGEEEIAEDVVCPNVMQNIEVVSTATENARTYASLSSVGLGSVEYEVNAYMVATDGTCKGVIRGVDLDIDPVKLQALIVHDRNSTALKAKQSKNSKAVAILFHGLKVPNHVICGASMFRRTLFRRQTNVCYTCGKVGHCADVCPTPDEVKCRGCGKKSPSERHECKLMCKLCGGAHVTADKKMQAAFLDPVCCASQEKRNTEARLNLGFQRDYTVEDFAPLHTDKPGGSSTKQRGRSRTNGNRSQFRGRSASMERSLSRTSSVRITTPGTDKGPWATKGKKTSQPLVKGVLTRSMLASS